MEKADKMGGDNVSSLNPDEKREIAEIRKVYDAKFAEVEILVQDKEKKVKGQRGRDRNERIEVPA